MSTLALPAIEPEPRRHPGWFDSLSLPGLAIGAALLAALAVQTPSAVSTVEPSSGSARFAEAGLATVSVAGALELAGLPWRVDANLAPSGGPPAGHAPPHAALMVAAPQVDRWVKGGPISVNEQSGGAGQATCSVVGGGPVGPGGKVGESCNKPLKPQSAYDNTGQSDPDMSKCSVAPESDKKGGATEISDTCSTVGVVLLDPRKGTIGGEGSCSAHGPDVRTGLNLFGDTGLASCSTSGGTGEPPENVIKVCSIQPVKGGFGKQATGGGGCSAGALGEDDPRTNPTCSVHTGSADGSSCSVWGDSELNDLAGFGEVIGGQSERAETEILHCRDHAFAVGSGTVDPDVNVFRVAGVSVICDCVPTDDEIPDAVSV